MIEDTNKGGAAALIPKKCVGFSTRSGLADGARYIAILLNLKKSKFNTRVAAHPMFQTLIKFDQV